MQIGILVKGGCCSAEALEGKHDVEDQMVVCLHKLFVGFVVEWLSVPLNGGID